MKKVHGGRPRAKVSITVDPVILNWNRSRQDEAMIEQFSAPEAVLETELRAWRQVRRAAASRT